jgi:hypothetical protein
MEWLPHPILPRAARRAHVASKCRLALNYVPFVRPTAGDATVAGSDPAPERIRDVVFVPPAVALSYFTPITIESGPLRCSTRVCLKPASRIQAAPSAPV